MTQDYPRPITPSPELVQQWATEWMRPPGHQNVSRDTFMTTRAAQWGADQELEACCGVLDDLNDGYWSKELRAARRPKPPSLKEEALEALEEIGQVGSALVRSRSDTIRKALEQLDD